jgi:hypothetical protein
MAERPFGITILGILWVIGGLILLSGGLTVALVGGAAIGSWGWILGIIYMLWGILELILGVGSFMGWPIVWMLGVALAILSVVQAIYAIFTSGWAYLVSALIAVVILYYLFQPDVKAWFGQD